MKEKFVMFIILALMIIAFGIIGSWDFECELRSMGYSAEQTNQIMGRK